MLDLSFVDKSRQTLPPCSYIKRNTSQIIINVFLLFQIIKRKLIFIHNFHYINISSSFFFIYENNTNHRDIRGCRQSMLHIDGVKAQQWVIHLPLGKLALCLFIMHHIYIYISFYIHKILKQFFKQRINYNYYINK